MIERPPSVSSDARTWAMLSHLAGVALLGAPFGHIIGPLVIYLTKKDEDPYIAEQSKESINFQITVAIIGFILFIGYGAGIAATIFSKDEIPWFLIVVPLFLVLGLFDVACVAIACIQSYRGDHFRYPLSIRFVR